MKLISLFVLITLAGEGLVSQERFSSDTKNFLIRISGSESKNFTIALSCENGCAWKTLNLTLGDKASFIDQYGTKAAPDQERSFVDKNADKLADFTISIQKDSDQLKLECSTGCAWKTLSFTMPKPGETQGINRSGTVGID